MTESRTPQTKTARQARIVELISRQAVRSQGELAHLLTHDGLPVTQGTLSKDLVDVGAVRVIDLGCGPGALLTALRDDRRFTDIVGVDVSPAALLQAERDVVQADS